MGFSERRYDSLWRCVAGYLESYSGRVMVMAYYDDFKYRAAIHVGAIHRHNASRKIF